MSFWDELKQGLGIALSLVMFITLLPVALSGGFFATKYLYCDVARECIHFPDWLYEVKELEVEE